MGDGRRGQFPSPLANVVPWPEAASIQNIAWKYE